MGKEQFLIQTLKRRRKQLLLKYDVEDTINGYKGFVNYKKYYILSFNKNQNAWFRVIWTCRECS